jgi:hypothetical protein
MPPGCSLLLEHHGLVALDGQIVGAGHAGGAGADDGDLLVEALWCRSGSWAGCSGAPAFISCSAMNFLISSMAMGSSTVPRVQASSQYLVADAAADGGERVVLLDELQGVLILALAGHLDVALDGDVGGAGHLAGGGAGRAV